MTTDESLNNELDAKFDPKADKSIEGTPENPGIWWTLVNLEPALLRGLFVAVFSLLGSFGLLVTDNVQAGISGLVFAVIALAQAVSTAKAVTPNKKVVVYKPDPVLQPNTVEAGEAVSTNVQAVANAAADLPDPVKDYDELPFPGRA